VAYVSLYRKYRSQTFSDLIGQDHIVRTLQNGIKSSRIAHSYLFTGPRGTGKTSTARLLAKALNCENGPTAEPDNACEICASITAGSCIDVVEMDAASESGVDDIREKIVEAVEYRPMACRYKIFIIDEVHDLSAKAFDALLKTIEEPPAHIIFILATTEYNKVPPTIRSRCQKYEFHRGSLQDLISRLEYVLKGEGVEADPAAVTAIARMADGGYRDALSLLEQAILTSDGKITLEQVYSQLGLVNEETIDAILLAMKNQQVAEIIERLSGIARQGRDPRAILDSMMFRLSDLNRAAYGLPERNDATRDAALHEMSVQLGRDAILRFRGEISEVYRAIRDISLPRIWLEAELIRIASGPVAPATPVKPVEAKPASAQVVSAPVVSAPVEKKPVAPVEQKATNGAAAEPPVVKAVTEVAAPIEKPPTPTGDESFDVTRSAWHEVRITLSAQSALMKQKLEKSQVLARQGNTVAVQVEREMDLEWINKPKPASAILGAIREKLGAEIEVRYVVKKRENGPEDPASVELPLEGQALDKLMREIFKETPPSDPEAKEEDKDPDKKPDSESNEPEG
jgi:DNA polymerase-3 subunit gamma/tau